MLYAKLIGRIALSTCENIARIELYLQGLLPKIVAIYTINICTAYKRKYPKQAINRPAISFWVFLESLVEQRVAFEAITEVLHESAAANIWECRVAHWN